MRRSDGSSMWGLVSVAPEFRDGQFVGAFAVVTDVTRLKNIETELTTANAVKSQFLASMSHEMRTPLNAVIGYAQVLATDADARTRDLAEKIKRAGLHQLLLVSDLLDLTRIEQGRLVVNPEVIRLADVVDASIELHHAQAAEPVDVQCTGLEDLVVFADPGRLTQVFLNLLTNAAQHGTPRRPISISATPDNEAKVRIGITNEGPALEHQIAETMFEPFVSTGSSPGIGLGLAIARELVALMGGEMGVTNPTDHLTTFWLTLEKPPEARDRSTP